MKCGVRNTESLLPTIDPLEIASRFIIKPFWALRQWHEEFVFLGQTTFMSPMSHFSIHCLILFAIKSWILWYSRRVQTHVFMPFSLLCIIKTELVGLTSFSPMTSKDQNTSPFMHPVLHPEKMCHGSLSRLKIIVWVCRICSLINAVYRYLLS